MDASSMLGSDLWMWLAAIGFATAVVGGYAWSFSRRRRHDAERLEEASRLGLDRPLGQFPYIDPALCIGCGACVAACPEGDVLGLVGGQAVVINGVRCVGIAYCETACPVGAIEVGLGSAKGRADLPVLDDLNQTALPGVFIAGELSGLSLVRNALAQGSKTVHEVHRRTREACASSAEGLLDLVIVGGGPAGLAAALQASELGLDYLLLEQEASLGGTIFHYPRRKLVHTQPVDLPGHGRIAAGEHSKEDLLALFEGLVERHALRIAFGRKVVDLASVPDGGYAVRTETGDCYRTRYVILAMGRRGTPRRLGVPGEELPKVMYQVRDAELYRGQRILCVGGGDSAVEAAMGLSQQPGNVVHISYRKERFARIKRKNEERLARLIAQNRIQPLLGSTVQGILPEAVRIELPGGPVELPNDYVFVLAGGEPPYGFLKRIGIRFGDQL